ncbi:hypothetical protein DY000_02061691 [Brassica cretica]|uniref:Uncharacterized protein n=1 Tax=Brassica cretica TaxID=69181 RepID=A0ABQ7APR4_BRACR|nr:hypothetical protein DY000_02061691 [Brassica cretica]
MGKRRFFVLGRGGEYRALEENEEAREKRLNPLLERRATEARVKIVDWTENMVMAYSSSEMSKREIYRETPLMKRGETKSPTTRTAVASGGCEREEKIVDWERRDQFLASWEDRGPEDPVHYWVYGVWSCRFVRSGLELAEYGEEDEDSLSVSDASMRYTKSKAFS